MEIEHEAKVLEVDPSVVAAAIVALGGVDHGEVLQRRYVYDTCPPVEGKWVRLREAGSLTSENTTKIYARYGFDLKSMPIVKFQPSS